MNKFSKRPDRDLIFGISLIVWIVIMFLVLFMCRGKCLALDNTNNHANIICQRSITSILDKLDAKLVVTSAVENEVVEPEPFYSLTDYERWLVESIVAGESGIEPYNGKVAVASCILNACLLEDKRPEEIQTMYGYVGWKPIEEFESECMEAYGNTDLADEVRDAVSQVFDNGEVLSNEILWFYNPDIVYSSWHEIQKFVLEIGSHLFFAP